jgi:uncharacterized membrane protein
MRRFQLLVFIMIWPLAAITQARATQYVVTPINPDGAYGAIALGISNSGYVVGTWSSVAAKAGDAFIWDAIGGFRTLSPSTAPRTQFYVAFAVNDQGIAVGQYHDVANQSYACYWDAGGNFHDLATSPGGVGDINNSGLAVGNYIWDLNGTPSIVSTVPFNPCAINDQGQVVGDNSQYAAVVRDADGAMHTIDGDSSHNARGWDINNPGEIAGSYAGAPCMWDSNGNRQSIDLLNGDYFGLARGINDAGTVVGESDNTAFVWTQADGTQALPGLGGIMSYACSINSSGVIAGYATDSTGKRAVIWTPVPEPSSFPTILLAIGSIAGVIRAKQRRK